MQKPSIQENEFSPAPGGAGSINGQPGLGTFASPEVSQNSANFAHSDNNKANGNHSNTRKDNPDSGSMANDFNAIFCQKVTPTPDEIVSGINYELGQQIKKDKTKAKEIVLKNLRKDPKYYSGLKMLNIDDESMVNNMSEGLSPVKRPSDSEQKNPIKCAMCGKPIDFDKNQVFTNGPSYVCKTHAKAKNMSEAQHPNDKPLREKVEAKHDETKKIFEDLAVAHDNKYVVNSGIVDVMKLMWEQKRKRSEWKNV